MKLLQRKAILLTLIFPVSASLSGCLIHSKIQPFKDRPDREITIEYKEDHQSVQKPAPQVNMNQEDNE